MTDSAPRTGYAPVNGLRMYYEIHGTGQPLVVLHGSFMTIELMGKLIPELARSRQVIAVEFQGHGHTPDSERPITYENLADDTAALLGHLGIERADIYGFSLGGGVALQVAMRHPEVVRKLVLVSASYTSAGLYPEVIATVEHIRPELFDGTPWRAAYDRVAPNPQDFPALVTKLTHLDATPFAWSAEADPGADRPDADRHRRLGRHAPGARGGDVPAARRRRVRRSGRPPRLPTGHPPGHDPRGDARPRRLAGAHDPAVPRRADAGARLSASSLQRLDLGEAANGAGERPAGRGRRRAVGRHRRCRGCGLDGRGRAIQSAPYSRRPLRLAASCTRACKGLRR